MKFNLLFGVSTLLNVAFITNIHAQDDTAKIDPAQVSSIALQELAQILLRKMSASFQGGTHAKYFDRTLLEIGRIQAVLQERPEKAHLELEEFFDEMVKNEALPEPEKLLQLSSQLEALRHRAKSQRDSAKVKIPYGEERSVTPISDKADTFLKWLRPQDITIQTLSDSESIRQNLKAQYQSIKTLFTLLGQQKDPSKFEIQSAQRLYDNLQQDVANLNIAERFGKMLDAMEKVVRKSKNAEVDTVLKSILRLKETLDRESNRPNAVNDAAVAFIDTIYDQRFAAAVNDRKEPIRKLSDISVEDVFHELMNAGDAWNIAPKEEASLTDFKDAPPGTKTTRDRPFNGKERLQILKTFGKIHLIGNSYDVTNNEKDNAAKVAIVNVIESLRSLSNLAAQFDGLNDKKVDKKISRAIQLPWLSFTSHMKNLETRQIRIGKGNGGEHRAVFSWLGEVPDISSETNAEETIEESAYDRVRLRPGPAGAGAPVTPYPGSAAESEAKAFARNRRLRYTRHRPRSLGRT